MRDSLTVEGRAYVQPPGPASGAHLSEISARFTILSQLDEMSQAIRHKFATFILCSGSGLMEKGSIDSTIGFPVRFKASRIAPKRTEESSA